MKLLAYITLIAGIAVSAIVGVDWYRSSKDAKVAALQQAASLEVVGKWQFVDRLNVHNLQSEISNDQLQIRNDELDVRLAELEGRSAASANQQLVRDEHALRVAEQAQSLYESNAVLGPDPRQAKAQAEADAATVRADYDKERIQLDRMFSFVGLGLLIASGFAFAFAGRQSNETLKASSTDALSSL